MTLDQFLAQNPEFKERVDSVKGLSKLPEGYEFNTLEILVDDFSVLYVENDKSTVIPIEPDDFWSTVSVYFDQELVYATVNGLEQPLVDRAPNFYFHCVD